MHNYLLGIPGVTKDSSLAHALWNRLWPHHGNFVDEWHVIVKETVVQNQHPPLEDNRIDGNLLCRVVEHLPLFPPSVDYILVRHEYVKLLEECEQYWQKRGSDGAFVLSGHPGVGFILRKGKQCSCIIVLVLRLLRGQVTAFQVNLHSVYLFTPFGAYRIPPTVLPQDLPLLGDAWALVDSNDLVVFPSTTLLTVSSPFSIVYTSSPAEDRWASWGKCKFQRVFHMDLPSWTEVVLCFHLQPKMSELSRELPTEDEVHPFYAHYGPSIRHALRYSSGQDLVTYKLELMSRVDSYTFDSLRSDLLRFQALHADDVSHKIFLTKPASETRIRYDMSFVSPAVRELVLHRLVQQDQQNVFKLYKLCRSRATTRAEAGHLLERRMHEYLPSGAHFTAYRYTSRPANMATAVNDVFTNANSHNLPTQVSFGAVPSKTFTELTTALHIEPNTYYRPTNPSFAVFGSFIWESMSNTITIIQVTVAGYYDVKEKGYISLLNNLIANGHSIESMEWRYLGIVPVGDEAQFQVPKQLAGKFQMYCYEVPDEVMNR